MLRRKFQKECEGRWRLATAMLFYFVFFPSTVHAIGNGTIVLPTPVEFSLPVASAHADASDSQAKGASRTAEQRSRADRVGMTVRTAHELMAAHKDQEALSRLRELDALEGKTTQETYLIERTRVAIASRIHDEPLLLHSMEAAIATGHLPADERTLFENLLEQSRYRKKQYEEAMK